MATLQVPYEPPFEQRYSSLLSATTEARRCLKSCENKVVEECELPLIDLYCLQHGTEQERSACVAEISKASSDWGFFQVVNHGINNELLQAVRKEQKRLFHVPFEKKAASKVLNESYRWGNPTAISLDQLSWSEAFHVPLSKLVEDDACFLRLNRYPPCPILPGTFGLMPHTDSDFLTILHQDHVGGLQLMKDSKWVAVKPNPSALIVNIGDLFQAWSNDVYKSVEHKVMTNRMVERYSIAYFLCPSYESTIGSCKEPSHYKKFTFKEFRNQVQEDVKRTGYKVGLSRFLL